MSVEGKPCIRCGSTERNKTGKCKPCESRRGAAWRDANKERHLANGKAWRDANKERNSAISKAWREANKERNSAISKAWRDANKERNSAISKAWREANKERHLASGKAWREANKDKCRGFNLSSYRRKKTKSFQSDARALSLEMQQSGD